MRKSALLVVVAAFMAVGLAACSTPTEEAQAEVAAEASNAEDVQATPAPLVAEKPEGSQTDAAPGSPEEEFLQAVRVALDPATTQIPDATDEQLLAAGADACEQIAAGTMPIEVLVIEGETPNGTGLYVDSRRIGLSANEVLCP